MWLLQNWRATLATVNVSCVGHRAATDCFSMTLAIISVRNALQTAPLELKVHQ